MTRLASVGSALLAISLVAGWCAPGALADTLPAPIPRRAVATPLAPRSFTATQPLVMTGQDDGLPRAAQATPTPRPLPIVLTAASGLTVTGQDAGGATTAVATPSPRPLPITLSAPSGFIMTGQDAGNLPSAIRRTP